MIRRVTDRACSPLCSRSILLLAWAYLVSSSAPAQGLDVSNTHGLKHDQVNHSVRHDAGTGRGRVLGNPRINTAAVGQSTVVGLDIPPSPSKDGHVVDRLIYSFALSLNYLKQTFCRCITSASNVVRFGHGQSTATDDVGFTLEPQKGPINDSAGSLDAANNLATYLSAASAPALVGAGGGRATAANQALAKTSISTGMQTPNPGTVTRKMLAARKATRTTSKPKPRKKPAKKSPKKKAPPKKAAKKPTPRKKDEYYECGVYSAPNHNTYAWDILKEPIKCVATDQKKYPNYYFACFCTYDAGLCKDFAEDVDYAVHNPEVNGAYYIGEGKTIEEAREIYVGETCYVDDPSCTAAIDAGVGGLAGCGGD